MSLSRRSVLQLASAAVPLSILGLSGPVASADTSSAGAPPQVSDLFPTQSPELVREVVFVSHFNLQRVQELVGARPSLARAAWDWGFGDWESALGAASHMGNRAIAEYLISQGARPSLFSAAMLGQLDVVKGYVTAQPGVQRIRGPHSIPLLAHAKAGKEDARQVYEFLKDVGGADADPPVPISDGDVAAIAGTYPFGITPNQQVDITADKGQLTWTRRGMVGRVLIHLGNRAFYPMGAPAVSIRFTDDRGTTVMTIHDPDLVFTARRKTAP